MKTVDVTIVLTLTSTGVLSLGNAVLEDFGRIEDIALIVLALGIFWKLKLWEAEKF
jgi:hypothetical protein